ncbi:probable LRR receptor-like serine/threonine-protein kinase At1g07650 [Cornus florida]|uniref:probable LRR receptor-like serine/threonine-protein kinase At1g07650 n=1 Tax=Cornus florida TaxID=4283 RepID=UPI0028A030D3|nr:probable LRR receptor-like serine/threonine-protein kinase At1g07650 [Cornus florida]
MAIVLDVPKSISTLLLILFILICSEISIVEAQAGRLPQDEENALREIADQLGKKDWNFSINPCDRNSSWITPKRDGMPTYNNTLICNCSFPTAGECHVIHIFLKGQDLAGVLPPSLAKLRYLKSVNLDRNYLSGTIPSEWASTKLEILSVSVNRLSGPIPDYLGTITTLKYLVLESNQFYGIVPAELGKLVNLKTFLVLTISWESCQQSSMT